MPTTTNPRIAPLDPAQVTGSAKTVLDATKKNFGAYLNYFATLAHAPVVLEGYTTLSATLGNGELAPKIREEIAVAISSRNNCGYCLTAHGHAAGANGIGHEELTSLFNGKVNDAKEQAAIDFAIAVLDRQGRVSDAELSTVKAAGFTDGEVLEIIAHVAMTVFSNALNNVSTPTIDLPDLPIALPATS